MYKKNVYLASFLLLVSCSSNPSVGPSRSGKNKPDWITRQPADDSFWYGVGIANLDMDDPRQAARQRAFSEIAEQLKHLLAPFCHFKIVNYRFGEKPNLDFEEFKSAVIRRITDIIEEEELSSSPPLLLTNNNSSLTSSHGFLHLQSKVRSYVLIDCHVKSLYLFISLVAFKRCIKHKR